MRSPAPFSIFTKISEIPKKDWNAIVAEQNIFLSLNYLEAISRSLKNEIQWVYVLVYDQARPLVAGVFQRATFTYKKGSQTNLLLKLFQDCKNADESVSINGLVCGNIFATGPHGFAHSDQIVFNAAVELMAAAAKQVRKLKGLEDSFSIQLFKDFDVPSQVAVLEDFNYRAFQADVTMVLAIDEGWETFQQYLDTMKAKYRTKANSAFKKATDIEILPLSAKEIVLHQVRLQGLFNNVQQQSSYSYGESYPKAFHQLKLGLGEKFICKGAFLHSKLIGFCTAFINGSTLEASYVGLDYNYNIPHALYERLLYHYVEIAIEHGMEILHLGRTSELIKSAMGAVPQPKLLYAKHTSKLKNALLKPIIENISPSPHELRTPFKASFYKQ
ncbi:peptidogalycan biosysnthesis protein [Marinirhabdus gelatinilytica]|uniref:Putative N-acyltransferase n=1 Tax=Marinirhabdus gelatinilytica TaxID=1703343 RepID=A0A370QBE5_9FLAO|nr:peptidogalycan biosysnthesis protein [Marinirhabdus gelatinilytica]RDK85320.1 putative N-acyltransferase [Marinirhabdus gelatinilytica]